MDMSLNKTGKQKNIFFWIIIIMIVSNVSFCILSTILHLIFPEKEVPVDVIVNDLANKYYSDNNKYKKTIAVIKRINEPEILQIHFHASDTKEHNFWLLNSKGVRINNQYPFFINEMEHIWNGELIGGRFYKNNIDFSIYSENAMESLIYTELAESDFISHFRDSMEYCVYPQIPKSPKHWIVKLEDNWYLYDGYFKLEME